MHKNYPGQLGVTFSSGGYTLLGTLFMPPKEGPSPTAIILHGVPGIEKNYDIAHAIRDAGWNSLIFHFRGSWGSQGLYQLATILDDVRAAVDFLDSGRIPEIDRRQLFLIGHSLGGWAAVLAGVQDPRVQGVCVYGAVTDLEDLAFSRSTISEEFIPWLNGVSPHAFASEWADLAQTLSPVNSVSKLSPKPLLVIHSRVDESVPYSQSERLFANALEPKQMLPHSDANHSFTWHRSWLQKVILNWLEEKRIR